MSDIFFEDLLDLDGTLSFLWCFLLCLLEPLSDDLFLELLFLSFGDKDADDFDRKEDDSELSESDMSDIGGVELEALLCLCDELFRPFLSDLWDFLLFLCLCLLLDFKSDFFKTISTVVVLSFEVCSVLLEVEDGGSFSAFGVVVFVVSTLTDSLFLISSLGVVVVVTDSACWNVPSRAFVADSRAFERSQLVRLVVVSFGIAATTSC